MTKPYREIIKFQGTVLDKETNEQMSLDEYIKKNINYFDKLKQKERIKKVNEFINNCPVIYEYFEKYFNYSPKIIDGPLSEDYEICRILSRLTNYILYAHDAERITKKVKYNFYTEKEFEKKINSQPSVEELAEGINKNNDSNDINSDIIIDFLVKKGQNYKKTIKQEIFQKDFEEVFFKNSDNIVQYPLKEYKNSINYFKKKLKEDVKNKEFYKFHISSLITDQIICKDKLKGTIYYKDVLPDSTVTDWDQFDGFNKKHVLELLRLKPRDLTTDLGVLIYDLEELLQQIDLDSVEEDVIKLYRDDLSITDIAEELDIKKPQYITATLNKISKKIMKKFEDNYEDWYYLNIVKGKYKKCSQCGEIKLVNKFGKDKRNKNGLQSFCKECDNYRKK